LHYFWKEVTEEHSPGAHRSWGRINTLSSHLKTRFKRNLDQSMLENALFFWKKLENRRSVESSASKPPLASGGWGLRSQTPELLLSHYLFQ